MKRWPTAHELKIPDTPLFIVKRFKDLGDGNDGADFLAEASPPLLEDAENVPSSPPCEGSTNIPEEPSLLCSVCQALWWDSSCSAGN